MLPETAHSRENIPKVSAADPAVDKLKQDLKTFWDNQQYYWDSVSSGEFVESPVRQRMASFLPAGDSVLDIACGTAANSEWIRGKCRYFGVDLSIKALRRPIHPSLMLACGDADDLPFRQECFDAVISTYVLEHAVEPVVTLREMCRVVKPHGKIILLGPAWDFPFWYPNSLRSKKAERGWRLRYTLGRLWGQLMGCSFGKLPFARVDEPDAFRSEFVYDADAVYIVWTYEVIRLMKTWGHNLAHWEVDDPLLGANPVIRKFKSVLRCLPIYRYAGSTILLVFEK